MRIIFSLVLMLGSAALSAQSDLKARIEYEEAEKSFSENKFEECFQHATKAEENLGKWTPKVAYMKILALDQLCDYSVASNSYTSQQLKEVKLYMDYANKNQDVIDMEKFKKVYAIEAKTTYLAKLDAFQQMPEMIKGETAYNAADYKTALDLWQQAAAKGNWLAMDKISDMYRDGAGVAVDYQKAMDWDKKAADLGYYVSLGDIAVMYYAGQGVQKDLQTAREKFRIAAEHDVDASMFYLGWMLYSGEGGPQDYPEAIKWLRKAAGKNIPLAMYVLGDIYMAGKGTEKNYAEGVAWTRKAADLGHKESMYLVGLHLQGEKDYTGAITWYRKAADEGLPNAQYQLATLYESGEAGSKDINEALKWYTKAAEQNFIDAIATLATLYETGKNGVKKDKVLAKQWQAKYVELNSK